ncbi:SagB family peptide dehydrogenase [Streptomyces sp. NPDC046900]|uniref:SagB family peptide dehydrogenase n=1 Tax=Streptomyces sp. NPDC046900 TaxID=3155473 RepID=UPI0033F3DA0F
MLKISLRFPEEVRLGRTSSGFLQLTDSQRQKIVGAATAELVSELRAIASGRYSESVLTPEWAGLRNSGWLQTVIESGQGVLVRIRTFAPPAPNTADPTAPLALSRFCTIRRAAQHLVLESPATGATAVIESPDVLALLLLLATSRRPEDLKGVLPDDVLSELLNRFAAVGFLVNSPGTEELEVHSLQWGHHEMLFHARSRWGHRSMPEHVGPSDRLRERFPPLPSRHSFAGAEMVPLARPGSSDTDLRKPFEDVLGERRSIRVQNEENPIGVDELGKFLFRCAHVGSTFSYRGVEYSRRPYPNGGGGHEIELYISARNVAGLTPGFYHYNAHGHHLESLAYSLELVERFSSAACRATTLDIPPQVVIVLAARFGRLLPGYSGMGYATILKNAGVLTQTMYLVAEAMGLAPCALGNGDTDAFAQATGVSPREESSVAEFALGSRPLTGTPDQAPAIAPAGAKNSADGQ